MSKVPGAEASSHMEVGVEDAGLVSRREWLAGATCVGAAAVFLWPLRAEAKVKPDAAKYQETPKDGHKCSGCQQFVEPDSCKVVDGKISPEGWCQLFAPKAA